MNPEEIILTTAPSEVPREIPDTDRFKPCHRSQNPTRGVIRRTGESTRDPLGSLQQASVCLARERASFCPCSSSFCQADSDCESDAFNHGHSRPKARKQDLLDLLLCRLCHRLAAGKWLRRQPTGGSDSLPGTGVHTDVSPLDHLVCRV